MTPDQIQAALERWNACGDTLEWAKGKDLPAIYACGRGDWLYWLLPKIKAPESVCIQLLVDLARLVLPAPEDYRTVSLDAIEAAEAWLLDPSEDNAQNCKLSAGVAAMAMYSTMVYGWQIQVAGYTAHLVNNSHEAPEKAALSGGDAMPNERAALAEAFRARISEGEFVRLATEAIDRILNQPQ